MGAAPGGRRSVISPSAGYRDRLDPLFESGPARRAFRAVTLLLLPRVSALAGASADIAASAAVKVDVLASQVAGLLVFGLSALALGIHLLEQKDFSYGRAAAEGRVARRGGGAARALGVASTG
ncbi:MAG: hypothetical protein IT372_14335 [Polyangiaceae bacterium]|nr:hypothetical protein [Polyangiaceae bacterium]